MIIENSFMVRKLHIIIDLKDSLTILCTLTFGLYMEVYKELDKFDIWKFRWSYTPGLFT